MVTNYTTKNYIKSGSENASRKLFILYIKSHIYTKFNAQKKIYHFPLRLAFSPILFPYHISTYAFSNLYAFPFKSPKIPFFVRNVFEEFL